MKDLPQQRLSALENATTPRSPAISDHFKIDPTLMVQVRSQGVDNTVALGHLQQHNPLPSPAMDLLQCPTDMLGELSNGQDEKHEQDQIDQWLASCSLLSPNGTIEMSNFETGDFCTNWQDTGKETSYFDNTEDSGDDGASSQETQLEDFDMNGS